MFKPLVAMEKKEKVVKVTSKSGKDFIQKIQAQKNAINSYFKGDISISELNEQGVRFVRTI